jgi:hypothetical protein
MKMRSSASILTLALMAVAAGPLATQALGQATGWVMPRTADGRPDLQGNWTNATMTPIQRPEGVGLARPGDEVERREQGRWDRIQRGAEASDPDREAPPVGGDGSTGAAGGVGGYNNFWIDAGNQVAMYNGEYRSSLIVDPPDGRYPPRTEAARARIAERRAVRRQHGQYDNPENRPLAERCILSFGSNGGPPMLPNYFYNNNYTIVQTPDHIMIMTEMVHDVRIIRIGTPNPLPGEIEPYFGDSWGHWEGDTLVVETRNYHPTQIAQVGVFAGTSKDLKVTERFTRADENTINYEFTMEDPSTWTETWSGEVPFKRLPGQVYEYACHEGNYALFNVLSGARAQERRDNGR